MTILLALVVALTIALCWIAASVANLQVIDVTQAALTVVALGCFAKSYKTFRLLLSSLAILVGFSTAFCILVYAAGTSPWPLTDAGLEALDAIMGISAENIVRLVDSIPWLSLLMRLAYFSIIPQTVFVLAWLGFTNQHETLNKFLLRFMVAALIIVPCFYFAPALGSCGTDAPAHYQGVVQELLALRSGTLTTVSWRHTEGIITFPSFHVIWGVLIMYALPKWPILLLNCLMIVSTITTGMHYAIDIVGGLLVCAFVIPITNRWADVADDVMATRLISVQLFPLSHLRFKRREAMPRCNPGDS